MRLGRTEAETCALNGWVVGTLVRGHEKWPGDSGVWTTWRITAIGEELVLAKTTRQEFTGENARTSEEWSSEHTVTFKYRDWVKVDTLAPANFYAIDGYRYGVRFADGSVLAGWNGRTQRQRALDFIDKAKTRQRLWLNDDSRQPDDLRLVRHLPDNEWEEE